MPNLASAVCGYSTKLWPHFNVINSSTQAIDLCRGNQNPTLPNPPVLSTLGGQCQAVFVVEVMFVVGHSVPVEGVDGLWAAKMVKLVSGIS